MNEKKINLDDDYIKFIRYGHHFIDKTGEGILAYISNNSFIDGITHRQMRKNLLESFDNIYILDLHGNIKKREICPDGSLDQNVFDIMQGVSINIFIKTGKKKDSELGLIYHYNLWGKRVRKYESLYAESIKSLEWEKLIAEPPYYFFTQQSLDYENLGNNFRVDEIFLLSNSGVQTGKDEIAISDSREKLFNTIQDIILSEDTELIRKKYSLHDTSGWNLDNFKKTVLNKNYIEKIDYKPFDTKYIYFEENALKRSRKAIVKHMLKNNYALISMRQYSYEVPDYCYTQITKNMVTDRYFMSYKGTPYIFPLYLYPESGNQITTDGQQLRTPNLNRAIVDKIAESIALTFTPEKEETTGTFAPIDILDYIYAVLHSPSYREKYKEFLKIDFPRVPYPKDQQTFRQLVALGSELRALHLLESPTVDQRLTSYPVSGDNMVGKLHYQDGKVYINETQYFDGVPSIAWEFYIGGYQPAQKWLKDRKSRELSFEDVRHYQRIIVALTETARIMGKVDEVGVEEDLR